MLLVKESSSTRGLVFKVTSKRRFDRLPVTFGLRMCSLLWVWEIEIRAVLAMSSRSA